MRILTFTSIFPNSLAPDYGVFLAQRLAHLAQRPGNHVEVVAPLPYVPKFLSRTERGSIATVAKYEQVAGMTVYHPRYALLPRISMPLHGFLMYAGCLPLVRSLHRQQPFDCIDAHYIFPDGLAAVLIGKSLGLSVMLTARGTDIHTFPKFGTIRPQIRWALKHAASLSAVSSSLAGLMSEIEPSIPNPVVIGNGVDTRRFYREDRVAARKKIGVDPDSNLVVSVIALRTVKGPDLLVRAASLLKTNERPCKVIFVGKGSELASLQQLSSELGCADMCKFAGQVPNEQLRDYYNAADVSCLPSRNEGWPNVVLESLACGTPVVATRVGAVPEILSDRHTGIVVDVSADSIHTGLRTALARSWDSELIANKARQYTWEAVAERADGFLRCSLTKNCAVLENAFSG